MESTIFNYRVNIGKMFLIYMTLPIHVVRICKLTCTILWTNHTYSI